MSEVIVNKRGRKGGRGLRPWLLIPKVLAVGVYFGSVATCAVIYLSRDVAQTGRVIEQVSWLMRFMVVPALLTTATFGVLLLMQHPMVFLRLRWFQVKLAIVLTGVPTGHFFMSSRLAAIRAGVADGAADIPAAQQMGWGFVVLLCGSALLVFMGRYKPRLGQNWAKTFASIRAAKKVAHG